MASFETKDSGERSTFSSGMQRDTQTGKTLYHLVFDGPMLKRWAELLTRGAEKYSPGNWLKAEGLEELDRFRASAARHFFQWMAGDRDEDHAAAVMFNLNGAEYVRGKLPLLEEEILAILNAKNGDVVPVSNIQALDSKTLRRIEELKADFGQMSGYTPALRGVPDECLDAGAYQNLESSQKCMDVLDKNHTALQRRLLEGTIEPASDQTWKDVYAPGLTSQQKREARAEKTLASLIRAKTGTLKSDLLNQMEKQVWTETPGGYVWESDEPKRKPRWRVWKGRLSSWLSGLRYRLAHKIAPAFDECR